ncbi:hypothetical protein MLD38_002942 [Melastoma candidum]|uniref:Uncharacterized protein n=1 Tax=Melastoma candidum TaxID=119954 RepID=A0ACB9S080_9MYRT|nr:hypothetical protein MLD38_002942 [Melastoma candidum]
MSSTLLEVTRAAHEEVERLERLIVKDLQNEPPTSKIEIYEDKDNARKNEIAALGGQTAHGTGTNVFSAFYDHLKEIREYHRKHPPAHVIDANEEYEALHKEEPQIEFSGEEAFGRYLDLHELFQQYINSKFGEPIEYSTYLDVFSEPGKISKKLKLTRQYKEYLENLLEYLVYFFERTEPLQDLDRIFSKVETDFEEQWAENKVEGWENEHLENGDLAPQHTLIDLDYYSTVEELMEVGPERQDIGINSIKGIGCSRFNTRGTLQQRAEGLFLTKHTPLDKLDKKHFVKGSHAAEQNGLTAARKQMDSGKDIALMEAKSKKICTLLEDIIRQTKENIEKKQALTYEEMEAERAEEEIQADTESDDDEQQIYNPLKLPMGWDGKPIPYWLYKLHGLGQEFKCEICGNHSYWGRRAFERHFKEWRHQHGMRCLGIPNTKNFNEITSIKEAQRAAGENTGKARVKRMAP